WPSAATRSRPARSRQRAQSIARLQSASEKQSPHDLHRQAEIPSPRAAEERAWLYASRLRGLGLDLVRGLRPRFDLGRDHRSVLRARDRAASRREALRHRLLVEDADLLPR